MSKRIAHIIPNLNSPPSLQSPRQNRLTAVGDRILRHFIIPKTSGREYCCYRYLFVAFCTIIKYINSLMLVTFTSGTAIIYHRKRDVYAFSCRICFIHTAKRHGLIIWHRLYRRHVLYFYFRFLNSRESSEVMSG